jgi:cyclopropane-fatty-acyl-phospholipid synthase
MAQTSRERPTRPSGRLARSVVLPLLRRTRHGSLTILEGERRLAFGEVLPGAPAVVLTVHDGRFYRSLLSGSLGVAEAYTEEWFDCDDLAELARLAALNMPALDRWRRGFRPLIALPQAALGWLSRNTPRR